MEIGLFKQILQWGRELDGVFTIKDLEVGLGQKSKASLYRTLDSLLAEGELIKVKRGIYALKETSLSSISSRIFPNSYISTGTVLAQHSIIGSIPSRRIQAVKVGSPRIYRCDLGTIEYLSIAEKLFFGFKKNDGCNWALPEKAFLDVCYFYYKGNSFSFNPDSDLDFQSLDFNLIEKYLENYDKRFVTFFRKIWISND